MVVAELPAENYMNKSVSCMFMVERTVSDQHDEYDLESVVCNSGEPIKRHVDNERAYLSDMIIAFPKSKETG